jgi:hypothetical protein
VEEESSEEGDEGDGGDLVDSGDQRCDEEELMNDRDITRRIGALVDEERALYERADAFGLDAGDYARLRALAVAPDRCWDLLRQRGGRSDIGRDPDAAHMRDAAAVEGNLQ